MKADMADVFELFPALVERARARRGAERRRAAAALNRSRLDVASKLLLMDEPSAGLAPNVVHSLIETIRALHQRGLTILLVEQNVGVAAAVAETAHVLQNGAIAYTGPAPQLINNAEVLASYLGR